MSAGGTERYLRGLAKGLNKNLFEVTYFYSDPAGHTESNSKPLQNEAQFEADLNEHGVKTIKFRVGQKNDLSDRHEWRDTDFFEVFSESSFDLLVTGRAGHPEYPFFKIRKVPIIDTIHLDAGIDWQPNISKVVFLSNWSLEKWVRQGGPRQLTFQSSLILDKQPKKLVPNREEIRDRIGITTKFTIGMHQRASDDIFSSIPIDAFSKICHSLDVSFILLGGGKKYREQVARLGLQKYVYFFDFDSCLSEEEFLCSLDVYAHGRKDGEINSLAIARAMEAGLPVISHVSNQNNGHIECIGEAGYVVKTVEEYEEALTKVLTKPKVLLLLQEKAKYQFNEKYMSRSILEDIDRLFVSEIHSSRKLNYKLKTSKYLWRIWYFSYRLKRWKFMRKVRKS